ncbi:MAG TPA: sigma-70 family RNA polymerase sigma factor [bacterium]|nr:sigma-70 family RNA polymerase sigma factor [bacterium]
MEIKIENYFPLVKKIVKRYEGIGVESEDLFQEGCIGLIEAKNNFKEEMNVNFLTYATYWIKKYILESVEKYKKQKIYISKDALSFTTDTNITKFSEISYKLNLEILSPFERNIIEKFYLEGKTLEEIAKELKIKREKVRQIKQKALMKLKNFNRKLTNTLNGFNKKKVNNCKEEEN